MGNTGESDPNAAMQQWEEKYGTTAVGDYVRQNLGGYVADLTAALKTDPGSKSAAIARPWDVDTTEAEKRGRKAIFEQLKAQFLPQYPSRVMHRGFPVEFNGQNANELMPPAKAFEVILFFEPETGSGPSDGAVHVGKIH